MFWSIKQCFPVSVDYNTADHHNTKKKPFYICRLRRSTQTGDLHYLRNTPTAFLRVRKKKKQQPKTVI